MDGIRIAISGPKGSDADPEVAYHVRRCGMQNLVAFGANSDRSMNNIQIILRDTPDGRVEVAIVNATSADAISRAALGVVLAALGEISDVRSLADGLTQGRRIVTAKLLIMQPGEALTFDERVIDLPIGRSGAMA